MLGIISERRENGLHHLSTIRTRRGTLMRVKLQLGLHTIIVQKVSLTYSTRNLEVVSEGGFSV